MKKLALLAVGLSLAIMPAASASHGEAITETGNIKVPSPASWWFFVGLTESQNPCGQPSPDFGDLQGFDGYWFPLPINEEGESLIAGHTATLTVTGPVAIDVDVWWYDEGCNFISDFDMATHPFSGSIPENPLPDAVPYPPAPGEQNMTPNEEGIVPQFAAWAVVDLVEGANVDFTFSVPV